MVVSSFFTDDDLINQLRMYFDEDERWSIDFRPFLNNVEDVGDCLFLRMKGFEFSIDKFTGEVVVLSGSVDGDDEV